MVIGLWLWLSKLCCSILPSRIRLAFKILVLSQIKFIVMDDAYGPLTRFAKLWVVHAPGMPGTSSRHRLQRKPPVNDLGNYQGTCVTHVPWCMSGSLTRGVGGNVPGIPGACVFRKSFIHYISSFHYSPKIYPMLWEHVPVRPDGRNALVAYVKFKVVCFNYLTRASTWKSSNCR